MEPPKWQHGFRSVITMTSSGLPWRTSGKLYVDLKDLIEDQIRFVGVQLEVSNKEAEEKYFASASYLPGKEPEFEVARWRFTREMVIFNADRSIVIKRDEIASFKMTRRDDETNKIFWAGE